MVKNLSFILKFVLERLRNAVIAALVIGAIIYIAFGKKMSLNYQLGFVIGCINFTMLSFGSDKMLSSKPKAAHVTSFLFFTLRYILIAFVIIYFYMSIKANIFAMIVGLITINFSLVISTFLASFKSRKEG